MNNHNSITPVASNSTTIDESLRNEINALELLLKEKKHELFSMRLYNLVGKNKKELESAGIKDIKITPDIDNPGEWTISYTHTIIDYDENDYIYSADSETETIPCNKTFNMIFGRGKKYYIKGNGSKFKIYKNSKNDLRIINTEYDIELDLEEQEQLIEKYSRNMNIPEWLAIKVFMYMIENDWNDANIIIYMSVI